MPRENNTSVGEMTVKFIEFVVDLGIVLYQIFYFIVLGTIRLFKPIRQKNVKGDIVLITGGGHGIGKELALLYASKGSIVVVWDINEESAKKTVEEIKQMSHVAYYYVCDISKRDQVLKMAKIVQEKVGDVTILINNAGIMPTRPILEHAPDEIQRIMDVNIMAHFWTIEAFLPAMKRNNHGHVVALSSSAGLFGIAHLAPYCASKFAVRGLQEALQDELRQQKNCNVHVTSVFPYMVNTGLCKKPFIKFENLMPLLEPKDVAQAIMRGQRTNTFEVTIPGYLEYLNIYLRMLPLSAINVIRDFIGAGVHPDS